MKLFHGFFVALSFLTRIPVRHKHEPSIGLAAPWFPIVGVVVGAIVGGVAWGVSNLTTPLVGSAVAVLVGVLITGAFHEDGYYQQVKEIDTILIKRTNFINQFK